MQRGGTCAYRGDRGKSAERWDQGRATQRSTTPSHRLYSTRVTAVYFRWHRNLSSVNLSRSRSAMNLQKNVRNCNSAFEIKVLTVSIMISMAFWSNTTDRRYRTPCPCCLSSSDIADNKGRRQHMHIAANTIYARPSVAFTCFLGSATPRGRTSFDGRLAHWPTRRQQLPVYRHYRPFHATTGVAPAGKAKSLLVVWRLPLLPLLDPKYRTAKGGI